MQCIVYRIELFLDLLLHLVNLYPVRLQVRLHWTHFDVNANSSLYSIPFFSYSLSYLLYPKASLSSPFLFYFYLHWWCLLFFPHSYFYLYFYFYFLVLQLFLSSSKPSLRFAAMRTLSEVAVRQPVRYVPHRSCKESFKITPPSVPILDLWVTSFLKCNCQSFLLSVQSTSSLELPWRSFTLLLHLLLTNYCHLQSN